MNWFDASGLTSLAKTALKEAQKTIDKALDIQEPSSPPSERSVSADDSPSRSAPADFLSSWGLATSGESADRSTIVDQPITESPSKANSQSLWGSFAGSFFEPGKSAEALDGNAGDKSLGSQDDLFSGSKLVVSEGNESSEHSSHSRRERARSRAEDHSRSDERLSSSRLNRLSIVSCESGKNSSESVEVLGSQSLKTTPDSEVTSMHSASHSSSAGRRLTSESVEILPDSLVSPSSIECLGFDSYGSGTECSSCDASPLDERSDKKRTPTGTVADASGARTADSVSLVADDDDDTISYNSVSECTAPTVLDTNGEDKSSLSPNPRLAFMRSISDAQRARLPDIKDSPTEQVVPIPFPGESYASSNDGSWSDRTLNADNDSIVTDVNLEDRTKAKPPEKLTEVEMPDDPLMDKLSDSSSFYNVNVTGDALGPDSAAFVNVDKRLCGSPTEGSPKDKERTSPTSSESRSELVKIGSDRTSTHTSGDELETATSSDIEIIPSPNGDSGHVYCRASPAKCVQMKHSKLDCNSSPHLVDLVLGKSLATKMRGHNRELSEASIQSNTSDESHSSENERLMRRLCEMAELLEAKESRLAEISRINVELVECNAELKSQLESQPQARHDAGDINSITEDYTQRMSALEKKFQQAIREKDMLRKQMDLMKSDSTSRRTSELESTMKEKDEMIAQLQDEGEKLSKQQFTQSNIIKKLRVKEKENEQVIKSLRDKIAEQTSELDRLKRSISAKEELEVTQIEAVYKLTNTNKKLDAELEETKSALDDTLHKYETTRTSLDAARKELLELQRSSSDMKRRRDALADMQREKQQADLEVERLRAQLEHLRAKMIQEESRWASREEVVRRELSEARAASAALEARAAEGAAGGAGGALLAQLASLQHSALERDNAHRATRDRLTRALSEAERKLCAAQETERVAREECAALQERAGACEAARADAESRRDELAARCAELSARLADVEPALARTREELSRLGAEWAARDAELAGRLAEAERQLEAERAQLDAEKRRSAILQEQVMANRTMAGDVSPPHSLASDTLSASLWTQEEGSETGGGGGGPAGGLVGSMFGLEEVMSRLQRREGEVRALSAAAAAHDRQLTALGAQLADARHSLHNMQGLQEQYDALLQMYGEKEEQVQELRLDLQDVTHLYKSQLDEIIALKRKLSAAQP